MSDIEQHEGGVDPRPVRRGAAGEAADALARIRRTLGADHASTVRRSPGRHTLEVVAASGRRFVSGGVCLPLDTCDILVRALGGLASGLELAEAETPFEALAYAVDLESAIALPVEADGAIAGAVFIAWEHVPASTEAVEWAVAEERSALVQLLRPAAATSKRLVVAHGEPIAAHGIAGLVRARIGAEVVVCGSLAALLDVVADVRVDAVVCAEDLDGHPLDDVAFRLRAAGVTTPLVAATRAPSPAALAGARKAGASGCFALGDAAGHVLAVLGAVLDGRAHLAGAADQADPGLTDRERQVLDGLGRGLTDAQIARELGVAPTTVKTYARRLLRKLEADSRATALRRARRDGLLG